MGHILPKTPIWEARMGHILLSETHRRRAMKENVPFSETHRRRAMKENNPLRHTPEESDEGD